MDKYNKVLSYLFQSLWAMHPEKLEAMIEIVGMHFNGLKADDEMLQALRSENEGRRQIRNQSSVAVVPIFGAIAQRMNMFMEMSGGTSTEVVGKQIDELVEDDSIASIILDIDSGGGEVAGVEALSDKIFAAREVKPIIAVADSFAASGAYWIGSAASEFVAAPGSVVGSIGVYMMHRDFSEADAKKGIKYTIVKAGANKAETDPSQPLSDTGEANLQRLVDSAYDTFTNSVARNRSVEHATVLREFGQGTVFHPDEAAARGMVDRVDTLQNVVTGQVRSIQNDLSMRADLGDMQKQIKRFDV